LVSESQRLGGRSERGKIGKRYKANIKADHNPTESPCEEKSPQNQDKAHGRRNPANPPLLWNVAITNQRHAIALDWRPGEPVKGKKKEPNRLEPLEGRNRGKGANGYDLG